MVETARSARPRRHPLPPLMEPTVALMMKARKGLVCGSRLVA